MGTFFTYVNYLDENLLYTARPASVGPMHWGGRVQKKPPQLQKMLSFRKWGSVPVTPGPWSQCCPLRVCCLLRWALGSVLGLFLWAKPQAAPLREARQGY